MGRRKKKVSFTQKKGQWVNLLLPEAGEGVVERQTALLKDRAGKRSRGKIRKRGLLYERTGK